VHIGETLHFVVRGGVEDHESGTRRDQDQFAVGCELEAVGAADVGLERGGDLLLREIDDGDSAVLRVGDPHFLAVGETSKPSPPCRRARP